MASFRARRSLFFGKHLLGKDVGKLTICVFEKQFKGLTMFKLLGQDEEELATCEWDSPPSQEYKNKYKPTRRLSFSTRPLETCGF